MTRYASILLVGGKSQRMGQDKAHLQFDNRSFAARIADVLRSATGHVVVVRAPGQALPKDLDADQILEDPIPDEGPLVGLAAGLSALDGTAEIAFAASVDAPFLKRSVIVGLLQSLEGVSHPVAAPRTSEQAHPLCAAYRVSLADEAAKLIQTGHRRLSDLLDAYQTRYITEDLLREWDPNLESLININTPEELQNVSDPRP